MSFYCSQFAVKVHELTQALFVDSPKTGIILLAKIVKKNKVLNME